MEKYSEQVFYRKTFKQPLTDVLKTVVLINFAIFTGKRLCWSFFFYKNVSLQSCNVIKKRFQYTCFPVNIAKFVRTPTLKNICERLFERFPTWTNNITRNIGSEEDIFSKTKQKNLSKTQLAEKKLSFSWCSWSFCFILFLQCMSGEICSIQQKMIVVNGFQTA